MKTNKYINKINEDGFCIIENLFKKSYIKKVVKELNNLSPKAYLPFTSIPWGYGNLNNNELFQKILNSEKLNNILEEFFKTKEYLTNHLILQNKVPLLGPSVEWHQEIYNINTYAPGYSHKDWKNFLQVYIAVDDQNLKNGCLKVIKGSHKFGKQKNYNIINDHLNHKRAINYESLNKLLTKCDIMDCFLKPGDAIIFNHLLVHGSPSNYSKKPRRSFVLQVRKNLKNKNLKIFKKETNYRSNFIIKELQKKIKSLKEKNIYKDFK
tara:strand:- start:880 stop:1677 length:798 start_codon:yes stop_codon:yes gene_type:complete